MKHRVWIVFLFSLAVCVACQHSGKEDMRLRLDYVSRCNRADTVFTEAWLPRVDSLVSYFDRHGNANERMMAHYLQGRVYHDIGEAPQALECYQTATEQADTTREDCDLYTLYAVYGQMAKLYHSQYLPDDEMKAIKTAERIAWKDKDTLSALIAFGLRARPYSLRNDTDSILFSERKTFELLRNYGCKDLASQFLLGTFDILLCKNRIDEIRVLMNIYEKESGMFDHNDTITQGLEVYYYEKGRYLLAVGKRDSALLYFHKALEGQTEAAYKGILSVYKEKGISDSIAKYAELFAAANDSSFLHVNQERIRQISAMYDYNRHRRIAQENAAKAKKARRERSAILMIAFILLVVGLVFIRRLRHKAKRQYIALSKEYEDTKSKMAVLTDRQRLMAYDHETTMKAKEKELQELLHRIQLADERNATVSEDRDSLKQVYDELRQEQEEIIRQHADDMEQRDHDVLELREKVMSLESQLLQYSSVDMEAAFRKTRIFQLFNERKSARYVSQCPTDKDWEQLIESFRTHFVRFYTFITIDHHLPVNQYRYCILYRLGFDATEIGVLMNKDKNQRYALRRFIYSSLFGSPVEMERFNEKLKQYF